VAPFCLRVSIFFNANVTWNDHMMAVSSLAHQKIILLMLASTILLLVHLDAARLYPRNLIHSQISIFDKLVQENAIALFTWSKEGWGKTKTGTGKIGIKIPFRRFYPTVCRINMKQRFSYFLCSDKSDGV